MSAPTEAFGVTVKADFRDFEKAMLRAQNQTDSKLSAMERRFTAANSNVKRQTGGLAAAARGGLSDLASSITGAGAGIPGLGAGMGSLGIAGAAAAVGVGALVMALSGVKDAAKFAADLTDAADRIGIGVGALQELRYAADETGVPLASLDSALETLNGTLGAFKTNIGAGKIKPIFTALGITPADLANVHNANDLLPILAAKLSMISDRATQVQLARKLGIEALLPILRQGAGGLERLSKEGRDLGLVLSDDVVSGLDATDRALEKNQQQIAANVRTMQATLAPFWLWVTTMAAKAAKSISDLFVHTESETLQAAINTRARIERGQRESGRTAMDARTKGIYDNAGRTAQDIVNQRRQRAAQADARAPASADLDLNLPSSGGGTGGSGRSRAVDTTRQAEEAQTRQRRFDDALSSAGRETLQAQSQLSTTVQQRASIAILMLDQERQERRVQLDRQVADGEITVAQRDQLLAAENSAWIAREANIAAMVDNEELQKARDQLLKALQQDALAQEAARQTYAAAKEGFRHDFVDGMRAALDGELGGFFESLADRFTDKLLGNLADQAFASLFGDGKGKTGSASTWMASIGKIFGFAGGGTVSGAGTGKSDSILARLSNGEFVVNAASTKKFGPLLEAINGGALAGFNMGGMVITGSGGPDQMMLEMR